VLTVNVTALLAFMLGATETSKGPETAPEGIVMLMDVLLQVLMVTAAPFSVTVLPPCEAPKPLPEITACAPITPVLGATPLITGAGAAAELIDTLSNVPVATLDVLPLLTPKPMYTFWPMLMVWLLPTCAQLTPSSDE